MAYLERSHGLRVAIAVGKLVQVKPTVECHRSPLRSLLVVKAAADPPMARPDQAKPSLPTSLGKYPSPLLLLLPLPALPHVREITSK